MATKTTDRLTSRARRELPDSEFGVPERREFPLTDAVHVRSAEAYFHYASDREKPELARRILERAARFGVEVHSPTVRAWALRGRDAVGRERKEMPDPEEVSER